MSVRIRAMLASVGWTGHVYPLLALATELRARGHDVLVDVSERWRETVEGEGLQLAPELEYAELGAAPGDGFGPRLAPAARDRVPVVNEFRPDVVVTDLLTVAPALAAEAAGVRRCVLVPHLFPVSGPGLPGFGSGLLPSRTPLGRAAWRALSPLMAMRLRRLQSQLNAIRHEAGLAPMADFHAAAGGLAMVGTFPQLEYPRRWPSRVHVTGPLLFERPYPEMELPAGQAPLVVVAASTTQDPAPAMLRATLEALAGEPVRVVATLNRRGEAWPGQVPSNAVVVDWVSYAQVMPRASVVVCNGGHGTVVRALADGVPVLVCPVGGDMAENGARAAWAGAGLLLPRRLARPGPIRLAVRRLVAEPRFTARARELAEWRRANDGAARAADLLESHAASG